MTQDLILDIIAQLQKQRDKGLHKYAEPVVPSRYSVDYWLNHWLEEQVDALVYGHAMKQTFDLYKRRVLCLEESLRSVLEYVPADVRSQLEQVLET